MYRVENTAEEQDIMDYISGKGFENISVQTMSHNESRYKSFKLSMTAAQFQELLNPIIWPTGIRVRKFIPPRTKQQNGDE